MNFPVGGGYAQCTQKTHISNGQNSGGREAVNSRGQGIGREVRSPDQSPEVKAHIPQSLGTKGNQGGWPS